METHLTFLELSVFNLDKIYLATIKLKPNKEIGQRATLKLSLIELQYRFCTSPSHLWKKIIVSFSRLSLKIFVWLNDSLWNIYFKKAVLSCASSRFTCQLFPRELVKVNLKKIAKKSDAVLTEVNELEETLDGVSKTLDRLHNRLRPYALQFTSNPIYYIHVYIIIS